jgi:hypothetical protein
MLWFCLALALCPNRGDGPNLALVTATEHEHRGALAVRALDARLLTALRAKPPTTEQWRTCFAVFLGDRVPNDQKLRPPMLGTYLIGEDAIFFRPRFPFLAGRDHIALLDPGLLNQYAGYDGQHPPVIQQVFRAGGSQPQPRARVEAIHPSGTTVPANLLRVYLHFSEPMRGGDAYRHIHLLDQTGQAVSNPFVIVPEELWDPERRRLTLLFHPGRIKRGLGPNAREGAVLIAGQRYRLRVDRAMRDARGTPLVATFEHEFRVTGADRTRPDPAKWRVTPPERATSPLQLNAGEQLDHALFQRLLQVRDSNGKTIPGRTRVEHDGQSWTFQPTSPWTAGTYQIIIDPALEDLAGNSPYRLFDRDLSASDDQPRQSHPLIIEFKPSRAPRTPRERTQK